MKWNVNDLVSSSLVSISVADYSPEKANILESEWSMVTEHTDHEGSRTTMWTSPFYQQLSIKHKMLLKNKAIMQ